MGHIELASAVSHIWFVKGTPSRLGLLLDISPRNLERVLYFAQYMITEVDEDARQRELNHLREEMVNVTDERVADVRPRREKLEAELEAANVVLQAKVLDRVRQIQAEREISREALTAAVVRAVERCRTQSGQTARQRDRRRRRRRRRAGHQGHQGGPYPRRARRQEEAGCVRQGNREDEVR